MHYRTLSKLIFLVFLFKESPSFGQWAGNYGNEWISYGQPYVRIGVSEKGVFKIPVASLPTTFKTASPSNFQLWHRGKEVTLIKADEQEIIFYGESNDGASDSLLFRPTSARTNPYFSFFSDEGSYFLTLKSGAKRASVYDGTNLSGVGESYHLQKDVYKFKNQFAFSSYGAENSLNNSFYVEGNSWTGQTIAGLKAFTNATVKDTKVDYEIQLTNWQGTGAGKVELEVMVNGMQEGAHNILIYTGKSATALAQVSTFPLASWSSKKVSVTLDAEKISSDGKSYLRVQSNADNILDWFGIGFYTLTYPQLSDLGTGAGAKKTAFYSFQPSSDNQSRIVIGNATKSFQLIDVSNPETPRPILSAFTSNGLEAMAPRTAGKSLELFVFDGDSQIKTISAAAISELSFTPYFASVAAPANQSISPLSYDYLIVTTEKLKDAAIEYGKYRSSDAGGGYSTIVMDIRSVYDQFNYGEPSPVGVKKFVDYMLSSGIRNGKHNLLIVGPSITYPPNIVKEMPNEVPTFGDPGSDILLVSGLKGVDKDIPAIPVGRITASSTSEVINYLDKVKIYEGLSDLSWKKNILHLNGGQSASEINQLKTILANLSPLVENGELGGKVFQFVKQNPADVETVNIAPEVNKGVGMITYFGHGSISTVDLNMGYVSDANRGYENIEKFPLMYFNGCGVGNIFFRRTPSSLSADWLLAAKKGAIGVIANSYLSYVSPSSKHLEDIYQNMFGSDIQTTMGEVVKNVAERIIGANPNSYDVANVHQTNLQGDPALRLNQATKPDYAVDANQGIILYSEDKTTVIGSSKTLTASVVVVNKGKNVPNQQIPVEITYFYRDGSTFVDNKSFPSFSNTDTLDFFVANVKSVTKIQVLIDPKNVISELNEGNNIAELFVDWEQAVDQTMYPNESVVDVVPPILRVTFNGRIIENNESINPNPTIQFIVTDDRLLVAERDTSYLDVYIKACELDENCEFRRLSFQTDLQLVSVSNDSLTVVYNPLNLMAGNYVLLVNARDASNNTISQAYTIGFKVQVDDASSPQVTVSPNPASSYVRFRSEVADAESIESIEWEIFNMQGNSLYKQEIAANNARVKEWYWLPTQGSGTYIYKAVFKNKNADRQEVRGKVVLIK